MTKVKLILSITAAAVILVSCSGTPSSPVAALPAQPQKVVDVSPVAATPTQNGTDVSPSVAPQTQPPVKQADPTPKKKTLTPPLSDALSRVTKKTFGLYVSPGNSPVSPEKFKGYHTGIDFETFANEQDIDISVSAVCDGPLILKKWATGYGGVAVQQCNIEGQDVTVVYGHLRSSSILPKIHDQIKAGESFAALGKGFSTETDGERKHLHLGINKGVSINILGYVQNQSLLDQWLDPKSYF